MRVSMFLVDIVPCKKSCTNCLIQVKNIQKSFGFYLKAFNASKRRLARS